MTHVWTGGLSIFLFCSATGYVSLEQIMYINFKILFIGIQLFFSDNMNWTQPLMSITPSTLLITSHWNESHHVIDTDGSNWRTVTLTNLWSRNFLPAKSTDSIINLADIISALINVACVLNNNLLSQFLRLVMATETRHVGRVASFVTTDLFKLRNKIKKNENMGDALNETYSLTLGQRNERCDLFRKR